MYLFQLSFIKFSPLKLAFHDKSGSELNNLSAEMEDSLSHQK